MLGSQRLQNNRRFLIEIHLAWIRLSSVTIPIIGVPYVRLFSVQISVDGSSYVQMAQSGTTEVFEYVLANAHTGSSLIIRANDDGGRVNTYSFDLTTL